MAEYWLGDSHLFDEKLANLRGFNSVKAHNDHVGGQIRELSANDHLWLLGDISGGHPEKELAALELLSSFQCKIDVILGNHDSASSIHRTGYNKIPHWLQYVHSVQQFGFIRMNNEKVLMSHYPYAAVGDGDNRKGPARYLEYRLPDVGSPLLHAHTHQEEPFGPVHPDTITRIEQNGKDLNAMCVSWESRRGLTTEAYVSAWIKLRREVATQAEHDRVQNFWGAFPKPAAKIQS